jgi:hypothetical protein
VIVWQGGGWGGAVLGLSSAGRGGSACVGVWFIIDVQCPRSSMRQTAAAEGADGGVPGQWPHVSAAERPQGGRGGGVGGVRGVCGRVCRWGVLEPCW